MTDQTQTPAPKTTFTVFWLFQANDRRHEWSCDRRGGARAAVRDLIERHSPEIELRGAYSTSGFSSGVDLILWLVADDAESFHRLAAEIRRGEAGQVLDLRHVYLGMGTGSQYDPNHGPAFMRGLPPKRYLSVYPFTKTPAWYLLPFERRRTLMVDHGKMGAEFPSILTNTVSSFGIADQEFIVALEDDDPATIIRMVQRLRAAEVREYTQVDTPIFLGLRKDLDDALMDAI